MKRTVTVLLFCLFTVFSVWAQETPPKTEPKAQEIKTPEALPTADEIIDKFVEASGGKAAIEKLTSRETKGVIEVMGTTGTWEGYAKAPNKNFVTVNIPAFGLVQQGFDGAMAWEEHPQFGMRELAGAELAVRKRDSDFYKFIHLKELYPKRTLKGKEKVGKQEAYVLELTPAEGTVEKMFFDTQSGLLIRLEIERETPQGKTPAELLFEDYREVDGVKLPFFMRQSLPSLGFGFDIKTEQVKHNTTIEEAKFKKP